MASHPGGFFRAISHLDRAASSSHFDDAMIRRRGRRMTVAQLRDRMDARFKAVDKRFKAVDQRFDAVDRRFDRLTDRMEAGFLSLHDKLNAILRALNAADESQQEVLHEHEHRLRDLEAARSSRQETAR